MRYFLNSLLFWVLISFLVTSGVMLLGYYLLMAADAPLVAPPFYLMVTIFPYIALYALPISLCLASGFLYWQIRSYEEHVFISFLMGLQKRLLMVRVFLQVAAGAAFSLLVADIAPAAYISTKKQLISCIWEQIASLPSKKLLQLNRSVHLYISNHKKNGDCISAQGVVLLLQAGDTPISIYAKTGFFYPDKISLSNASAFPQSGKQRDMMYTSRQLVLPSSTYLSKGASKVKINHMRFFDLLENSHYLELIWRMLQLLWVLLMPFIIWYIIQAHALYIGSVSIAAIIGYSGLLSICYFVLFRVLSHSVSPLWNGLILFLLPLFILFFLVRRHNRSIVI